MVRFKVLVACEFTGIVRDAFRARGHEAISCDLIESERSGPHILGDVRDVDLSRYDLLIAFPPCTFLCASAEWCMTDPRYAEERFAQRESALDFVRFLMAAPSPRIALENPIGVISSRIRPPDQIIQPYQFGHGYTKATCLWLKGLPTLIPTKYVLGRKSLLSMSPSPERSKNRSRTFPGIAEAMAEQWSREPTRLQKFLWGL